VDKQSNPEMIEREMEQTRASLVEKVAALEEQVVGTLQTATSTVKDTVESVRDTVSSVKEAVTGTVESVKDKVEHSVETVSDTMKEAFDLRTHIRNYPWACIGAATFAGFGIGLLIGERRDSSSAEGLKSSSLYETYLHENGRSRATAPMAAGMARAADTPPAASAPDTAGASRQPGLFDQLWQRLSDEVARMGEEAFHQLTTAVHRNLQDSIPRIIENVVSAGSAAVQNAVGSAVGSAGSHSGWGHEERQGRSDQEYRG